MGRVLVPCLDDLISAYAKCENGPLSYVEIVRLAQFSRFDPRLAELLVKNIGENWEQYDPLKLNTANIHSGSPFVLAVLLEFVKLLLKAKSKIDRRFAPWMKIVTSGTTPGSYEQFFLCQLALGGKLMRNLGENSNRVFLKWGCLGNEVLINKSAKFEQTLLPLEVRNREIKKLLKKRLSFTVNHYLEHLNGQVSRRQAERDLKKSPLLISIGKTRSKLYKAKGSPAR